jgi:hypothetical protein
VSSPPASETPPANPKLIILDSSVLLQIIATDQIGIVRLLRSDFGIQCAIVPAVQAEVACIMENVSKFRGRREQFKKALRNNTLRVIDRDLLFPIFGSATDSWSRQIESEGTRLYAFVDRGEAFTHGASMVLNAPTATNDSTAASRLIRGGEPIPRPILRFWDLVVFAHQAGLLTATACDTVRQVLHKIGERNHPCFAGNSFTDALPHFYARLACSNQQLIGATTPQEKLDERLLLLRNSSGT